MHKTKNHRKTIARDLWQHTERDLTLKEDIKTHVLASTEYQTSSILLPKCFYGLNN